jgi:hypothetical protein
MDIEEDNQLENSENIDMNSFNNNKIVFQDVSSSLDPNSIKPTDRKLIFEEPSNKFEKDEIGSNSLSKTPCTFESNPLNDPNLIDN